MKKQGKDEVRRATPDVPPSVTSLADARRFRKWTQIELGEQLHDALGLPKADFGPRARTYQNRISYWETGRLRPTETELQKLADVFKRGLEEVRGWFRQGRTPRHGAANVREQPGAGNLVLEVLEKLAAPEMPALMVVCATGAPAGDLIPALPGTVARAIDRGLSFVMAVPYPEAIHANAALSRHPGYERVLQYQATVLSEARLYRDSLRKRINPENIGRVAVFVPRHDSTRTLVPPSEVRYVLTVEGMAEHVTRSLYLWVTTENLDDLQPVETPGHRVAQIWQEYLHNIVDQWTGPGYDGFTGSQEGYWKLDAKP